MYEFSSLVGITRSRHYHMVPSFMYVNTHIHTQSYPQILCAICSAKSISWTKVSTRFSAIWTKKTRYNYAVDIGHVEKPVIYDVSSYALRLFICIETVPVHFICTSAGLMNRRFALIPSGSCLLLLLFSLLVDFFSLPALERLGLTLASDSLWASSDNNTECLEATFTNTNLRNQITLYWQ